MKYHNLHTHTSYSDGVFSPEQLVKIAKAKNLEVIGICDHAFSRKLPDEYQITSHLEQYLESLRGIQQSLEDIDLKIGVEIDASKIYGVNPSDLPFDILNKFDYVLFEYVNTENEYWGSVGKRDINEIIKIRDQLTIPVGLAHNDLQKNYKGKEKKLAKLLSDNDIFIELNQSEFHPRRGVGRNTREGLDYYEHFSEKLLNELVNKRVKVVAGTDAHTAETLADLIDVYQFIDKNNLLYHELVS